MGAPNLLLAAGAIKPRYAPGYDHCLTKFQAGSEQPLLFVVINNSSYPTVKNNNTA